MRMVLGVAVLALGFGCAHRATGPLESLPESAKGLARQLGRPMYGEDVKPLAETAALANQVLERLTPEQRAKVKYAPGLDAVASLVAHVLDEEGRDLADAVVEQLVWHAGVPATFVGYARARAEGPGSEDFLDDQLRALKFEPTETYVFGLARLDGIQIVVLAVRDVELDGMPKVIAPGAKVVLQGRVEGAFEDLRLLVDDGPSKVRTVDFVPTSDGRFKIELEAPAAEGMHLFEWTGEDPRGWRATLLTIPIFVGTAAPDTFGGPLASEKPNPLDLKAWETMTTDRVNALRKAEGLEPVTANAALTRLAVAQAARYAENPLAQPDAMFDQLNASGLRTRDAFQYRGVTYNLHSRLDRALARPSVREQVLKPNYTRMSVAFKAQPKGGYADTWMLSEALGPFDGQALSSQLLKEVNRRRTSKSLPALNENAQLAALAQAFADRTCAGATDAVASLEADARKLKGVVVRGYQLYTASVMVPSLMRTDKSNNPQTPLRTTLTHAGVGACEKGKPGTDANELAVFLLAEAAPR